MIIPNTIKDTYSAGRAWLSRQLVIDDLSLPDYDRPLKSITRKGKSPLEKQIAQYGFLTAITKNLLP